MYDMFQIYVVCETHFEPGEEAQYIPRCRSLKDFCIDPLFDNKEAQNFRRLVIGSKWNFIRWVALIKWAIILNPKRVVKMLLCYFWFMTVVCNSDNLTIIMRLNALGV